MNRLNRTFFFNCILLKAVGICANSNRFSFSDSQVQANSKATDWISFGMMANKDDFVIFEVSGKVKLGFWVAYVTGEGSMDQSLQIFYRISGLKHGALVAQLL